MGSSNSSVTFTPVNTGDMSIIPPDAPAGEWVAVCSVKRGKTSKDGFPMLILEWKLLEAADPNNEDSVGSRVTDFVTFFPEKHAGSKMGKIRFKTLCEELKLPMPAISVLENWDPLEEFIGELDGCKATIWTSVAERKDTGELQTRVVYQQPGALKLPKHEE